MGYRVQYKTQTITLNGEFEGVEFKAVVNPPLAVIEEISSGKVEDLRNGLAKVVREWNIEDETGNALDPSDPASWSALPVDLIAEIGNAYVEAVSKLDPLRRTA